MPTYRTDEQLEEIGRELLRRLGLENRVRPEPMTVIAKLKHEGSGFSYRRVPDRDMAHAEAEWDSDACEVAMRESIFVGMQRGDPHSCFVVFHELSHYCLGHKGTRNRIPNPQLRRMSAPQVKHEESEASRLAVILMAPEHLVAENTSAEKLASMFGLSLTAAILRKEEVDRIRRRRRGELRPLPASVKEMLRNARDKGFPIQTQLDD
jgi:Zn-dependent peptidase ImmA (M78 family)